LTRRIGLGVGVSDRVSASTSDLDRYRCECHSSVNWMTMTVRSTTTPLPGGMPLRYAGVAGCHTRHTHLAAGTVPMTRFLRGLQFGSALTSPNCVCAGRVIVTTLSCHSNVTKPLGLLMIPNNSLFFSLSHTPYTLAFTGQNTASDFPAAAHKHLPITVTVLRLESLSHHEVRQDARLGDSGPLTGRRRKAFRQGQA
jgi:hypothetical protein